MRRLHALASLILTLLTGGCLAPRAPHGPLAERPGVLPKSLPKADIASNRDSEQRSKSPRWDEFTHPADPPPITPVVLPAMPPEPKVVRNPADEPPKHPIVLAVECVLENRHDEAIRTHLQGYDPMTQEFLLRVLPTLSLAGKNGPLSSTDIAALSDQMASIQTYLRQNSDFTLSKLAFCESIKGYAIYKPLPAEHEFVAARPDRPGELVQLYVELRNFASRASHGLYETRLASHIEIQDEAGRTRWRHRFRPDDLTLVSRTRLGEYYHNYTFPLPATLEAGVYTLIVEMSDITQPAAPRTARNSIPLKIVADR